jgi:hypothetical protein
MAQIRRLAHASARHARGLALVVATLALITVPAPTVAGIDLVRMEGVVRTSSAPGSVAQLTLAIGTESVPFSVLTAQKISGNPAMAPEIFSALGPGPPPLRIEGRDEMTKKITGAEPGTRLTITGNLNAGSAFFTLMEVSTDASAGAQ